MDTNPEKRAVADEEIKAHQALVALLIVLMLMTGMALIAAAVYVCR